MVDIKYGRSSDPITSNGRRRLRRKSLHEEFNSTVMGPFRATPSRLQLHLNKKPKAPPSIEMARPLNEIANKAAISVSAYRNHLERAAALYTYEFKRMNEDGDYVDAMHKIVNHAHQRNPNKKW